MGYILERLILSTKYTLLFNFLSRVYVFFRGYFINPLNNNPTKWSNTLKQFAVANELFECGWIVYGVGA